MSVLSRWIRQWSALGLVGAGLSLAPAADAQPSNDACADAVVATNGANPFTTVGATTDSPTPCGGNSMDVWFRYTAPVTGNVLVDTCEGTTYDSVVGVFTGDCDALTLVVCNNDSCSVLAAAVFMAQEGVTYLISVGGSDEQSGTGVLSIGPARTASAGPDLVLREITDTSNWGSVNGVRGYSLGSATCNIGDGDVSVDRTTNQHAILGMNMYRLYQGAIEQIGLSWCKNATNAGAGAGCGLACNTHNGDLLGAGCMDVYVSSSNGFQANLGPRSDVNAFTGFFQFPFPFGDPEGDTIYKRCQVREDDLNAALYPGALYFMEGQWIAPDDALAGNALNNATYQRVSVIPEDYELELIGPAREQHGAIYAWQDHGGGANIPDPNVQIVQADVPGEGRFTVAARVFDNGNGTWRYEYAVFNLNSDRSAGSFLVPVGPGTAVSGVGFHDVDYHSGEPFDNTDWSSAVTASGVFWSSPESFAQNPNSNALRWGTTYNFRFTASAAPAPGTATIGLFKPGTPSAVTATLPVPSGPPVCRADWNHDSRVNSQDFFDFLGSFFNFNADFNSDGITNSQDFFDFLAAFFNGC